MADGSVSSVRPVLHYDDPAATHHFLVDVVGFREAVVVRDDPGATVAQTPHHTEFAAAGPAYAFSVRDPEGNVWTFGTSRGAP